VPRDPTIRPDEVLLRRVPPDQVVLDKNTNTHRPSSAAFEDEQLSVDIQSVLHEHGLDWRFTLRGHESFSLCSLTAQQAWDADQEIVRSPTIENPAHGDVVGGKPYAVRKKLARSAIWVHRQGT
jgi:hypothetical protein